MVKDTLYKHDSDEWETPQDLFDKYDRVCHFDLDVCATPENAKCARFFTKDDDGLNQKWGGVVWCNPPYSQVRAWVEKAHNSVRSKECIAVVMLLPARTDTRWFHDFIYGRYHIEFLKGRVKFNKSPNNAPFPSMIVTFT